MEKQAKDVMTTNFHTLSPDISIWEAVSRFKQATHAEDRRIFGMMVTDKSMNLIGMLSMYDILLFLRPKHIDIWGEMEEIMGTTDIWGGARGPFGGLRRWLVLGSHGGGADGRGQLLVYELIREI